MTTRDASVDLAHCDREPIHIPGLVQSFGCLIACRSDSWTVSHVSANCTAFGLDAPLVLGQPFKAAVGREASHEVANALSVSMAPGLPGRLFDVLLASGQRCDIAVHSHAGRIIVELEPMQTETDASTPLVIVRSMLARMQDAADVDSLCAIAVKQIRALINFDRVMIYRFLQDGSGCVIAESRSDDVPSFLEHHYPASDIPRQARELYVKSWLRLISNVHAVPVPLLVAASDATVPLDLTYSTLRSVSPVHIEYLRNMQVGASLSISIVVGGALWGLIACHNRTARVVPPDIRVTAEFFGQAFSLQLQTLARADAAEMLRQARDRIHQIVSELPPDEP
ncbi:MAG TPA: GAF domain-containing protein, partial [Hyphomicrobiaceae bacterium]|nr:GAF domain-containing protein [Hyphomicrobiaceae bacterium]